MAQIVLVLSGLGDDPLDELDGRTPLAAAETPNLDRLSASGDVGLFQPDPDRDPDSQAIGADQTMLAILGYDPVPAGRGALELLGAGASFGRRDVGLRWDLISSSPLEPFPAPIDEADAAELWTELAKVCDRPGLTLRQTSLLSGLMLWEEGPAEVIATPPGELSADQALEAQFPVGDAADKIGVLIDDLRELLAGHRLNRRRVEREQAPLDVLWPWGFGRAPDLPLFMLRAGTVASLLTGNLAARGTARAAGVSAARPVAAAERSPQRRAHRILNALQHAPAVIAYVSDLDRAGHAGDAVAKRSILERCDRDLVKPLADAVQRDGDIRLTILSDFATPCTTRRHVARPAPFIDVDPRRSRTGPGRFTEEEAAETGRRRSGPVDCRGWLWGR